MGQATHEGTKQGEWHVCSRCQHKEGWMVGEGDGIAFRSALDSQPAKQSPPGDCIGPFFPKGLGMF